MVSALAVNLVEPRASLTVIVGVRGEGNAGPRFLQHDTALHALLALLLKFTDDALSLGCRLFVGGHGFSFGDSRALLLGASLIACPLELRLKSAMAALYQSDAFVFRCFAFASGQSRWPSG
jgi:hypothetical protein